MNRTRRSKAGKAAVLAAVCLLFLFAAMGSSRREALPGILLAEKAEGRRLLLTAEENGVVWAVFGGQEETLLLKLDPAGEITARRTLLRGTDWAALRSGHIFLRQDEETGLTLTSFSTEASEEEFSRQLPLDPVNLMLFDCDSQGTVYAVESRKGARLRALLRQGEEREQALPGRGSFLAVDENDELWVYAGETLLKGGFESPEAVENSARPELLLGNDCFLDEDGVVCRVSDGKARPLFQLEEAVYATRCYVMDEEGSLTLSAAGGQLCRYRQNGELEDVCRVEGAVRGLCSAGVVWEGEDGFYYSPLVFSQPEATVSPSPTPPPGEDPPARVEGTYLITDPGRTVAEIRALMEPEAADIRDAMGNAALHGRMATGMTVNRWEVVVLGDCDGSGTVTGADVRKAMSMAGGEIDTPYARAADLDDDGVIGAADLVLLSRLAGK